MKKYFLTLLLLSICFCTFALQNKFIYVGNQQKELQFKGSRGFWKPDSFLSQDGFVLQRLPHFQILQMQNSKRKSTGSRKASAPARKATAQPLSKLDFPTEQLFNLLEKFYGRGGASEPVKNTNFLLNQFFSEEHMPASKWSKSHVANLIWEVTQLNDFVVRLHEIWQWKKEYDKIRGVSHG